MPVIGLDLGTHNFRAVELEQARGKIELKKYKLYDSPKINLETDSKDELGAYSQAVKAFVSEAAFSTPFVIGSLPESDVFTRVVKLPQMSEKDLRSSIAFEAEQYIPLPLKDVNFDFQIIGSDMLDKDKMNVLLVAAKNTILDKYVKILKHAKLIPKGLEPETLAIARVLGDNAGRPNACVLVNIGSSSTQIIICYKGFVRFTRSIAVGGDAFTRAVSQSLSLELGQADEYKKTYGLDSTQVEGKVFNALKPVFDGVIAEIKRSRIFYTTHNPNVIINRVILSGGTALMPGTLFYMANNLDLEVELANPWRNILFSEKLSSEKNFIIEQGPVFVTAVGLALKDFKEGI